MRKRFIFVLMAVIIVGVMAFKIKEKDIIPTKDDIKTEYIEDDTIPTKDDIKTEYIEDDTIVECTITNTSKVDIPRIDVVYYVYNDKGKCIYQVGDIFSLKAGESKYTDLDMTNDYYRTEIVVFNIGY